MVEELLKAVVTLFESILVEKRIALIKARSEGDHTRQEVLRVEIEGLKEQLKQIQTKARLSDKDEIPCSRVVISIKNIQSLIDKIINQEEILLKAVQALIDFVSLDYELKQGKIIMGEKITLCDLERAYKELEYFWNKLEDIGRMKDEND